MKRILHRWLFGVAVVAFGGFSSARAELIASVDFGTERGGGSGPLVIGSAGDTVNVIGGGLPGGSSFALDRADGTGGSDVNLFFDTPVGATGNFSFGFGADPSSTPMLSDYTVLVFDPGAAAVTTPAGVSSQGYQRFTIFSNGLDTGLDENETYNLYLIGQGDNASQTSSFSVRQGAGAGTTYVTGQTTGRAYDGTLVEDENYIVFRDISPTTWSGGTNLEFEVFRFAEPGQQFLAFNGLQLERVVAIPEPSTLGLLGLVGGMVAVRRRRR